MRVSPSPSHRRLIVVGARARRVLACLTFAALCAMPAAVPAGASAPAAPAAAGPTATPVASLMRPGVRIGIGDQKPDMFSDQRFIDLGVKHARLAIGWDALSSPWQVAELDAWLAGARSQGVEPLISFGHSRTTRRLLPSPRRLAREFRRLRKRYPWVKTYATWNEANHCGEPTCDRPKLVAAYYRALRRECAKCTIVAPELLDQPDAKQWVRAFRHHLGYLPKIWGLHNYVEANRFRMTRLRSLLKVLRGADVWLTETGGLVRRDNASTTDIPEGSRHASDVTRYIFDRVLSSNRQIKRVYIYHWNAGPRDQSWDSGLISPGGRERPALFVLRRVLQFGLRPNATFRSPAR